MTSTPPSPPGLLDSSERRTTDPTGRQRWLVALDHDLNFASAANYLDTVAGIQIQNLADLVTPATAAAAARRGAASDGYLLPRLGIAVIDCTAEQAVALLARSEEDGGGVLAVELERAHATHAFVHGPARTPGTDRPVTADTDGTDDLSLPAPLPGTGVLSGWEWGATAMDLPGSRENTRTTGVSVRVGLLSTGLDHTHPEFAGRAVYLHNLVDTSNTDSSTDAGGEVLDRVGNGTHHAGLITSIAPDVDLFVAKVFTDSGPDIAGERLPGYALDSTVLAGLEWLLAHHVDVACLPLAAMTSQRSWPDADGYSRVWEIAAQRALANGMLVIAAAGNDSTRVMDVVHPVAHPADCPSVLAVSALTQGTTGGLVIADYANGGTGSGPGRQIDLTAPGTLVRGPWLDGALREMSGTSVAAAYTAGVAALYCQQTLATGWDLWAQLTAGARRLHHPGVDVGAGLVTAPQGLV